MRPFLGNLDLREPATEHAILGFEKAVGKKLPGEYRDFLKISNGAEGFVGKVAYVILWGVHELPPMNKAYEVEDYAPGFLIFGSDGGGEAYGFDTRDHECTIVQIPFVGMAWELARPMAKSFIGFLDLLHRTE
jgi:hypothetical protein